MSTPIKNIILGVTGGIAAYKAVLLLRILQQRNCHVRVVMTKNAQWFVGKGTFQSLTGHPVLVDTFESFYSEEGIRHTGLADWGDAMVIAPATANIIGKYANGIADDFLSTLMLAFDRQVIIAPAMNPRMWRNPAVQRNVSTLKVNGTVFVGPASGEVACGHVGPGKMSEPEEIADHVCAAKGRWGDLQGVKILVTAGPTRERIDPVRYLTNHSSGKMGYAIASAAVERGADVTLVTGPVSISPHAAIRTVNVQSAAEMDARVTELVQQCDVLIMAAAVADWRPASVLQQKWKKSGEKSSLELERTTDVLKKLASDNKRKYLAVGFAAETENSEQEGRRKLREKNLDAIVINDVSRQDSGFGVDSNSGLILDRNGLSIPIELTTKRDMAEQILNHVIDLRK